MSRLRAALSVPTTFGDLLGNSLDAVAALAARLEPTLDSVWHPGGAHAIGTAAGWAAMKVRRQLPR